LYRYGVNTVGFYLNKLKPAYNVTQRTENFPFQAGSASQVYLKFWILETVEAFC